jgi:hypothetical protein
MKLFIVQLTPNMANAETVFLTVTKEQMQHLDKSKNEGGFLRYNISLYDEKISHWTKKNSWFIYNNEQTERQIKYFFEKLN